MGAVVNRGYDILDDSLDLENIELKDREWDAILVFKKGDESILWTTPDDPRKIQYEYLGYVSQQDREDRADQFPQHGGDFVQSRAKQTDFYRNERYLVVKALQSADIGLRLEQIKSMKAEEHQNKYFYYVGITETKARHKADKWEYELQLEPTYAVTYLQLMDEPLAKATLSGEEEAEHINEDVWKNMFVRYVENLAPEVYKPHVILNPRDRRFYNDSVFRIRDRLALIDECVTRDYQEGGAAIHIPKLCSSELGHCLDDFFPLHTNEQLEVIMNQLFSMDPTTWLNLPLDEFREYFGEYIAIYFAFLEFFTKFMIPLVIVGMMFGILQGVYLEVLAPGIEFFSLFTIIWCIAFPMFWRREEYLWAMRWGQLRFDFQERSRPDFEGVYQLSAINGGEFEYYPEGIRNQKRLLSFTIVVCFLLALLISTVGVVALRLWASETGGSYSDYIVSFANALVIMFFNNIYGYFAEIMNAWENYETDTKYENNLIIKVFVFRFVNSYASLYYMAFFRRWENFDSQLSCGAEECMEDLASQVAVIFLTQIFVSNAMELGALWAARVARGGQAVVGGSQTVNKKIWNEYQSEVYERTFDDYNELIVSLGYSTLFVLCFPFAPLACFISNLVESRIDGFKMCKLIRRPFPKRADDIGAWQMALEWMAWAVLATNLLLICFATDSLRIDVGLRNPEFGEVVTTAIIFVIMAIIWQTLEYFVKGTPVFVTDHISRMEHVEKQFELVSRDVHDFLSKLTLEQLNKVATWSVQDVLRFLQKVLLANGDEYQRISRIFMANGIDGKKFTMLTEPAMTKMGLRDHLVSELILNTRQQLRQQARKAKEEQEMLDKLMEEDDAAAGGANSARGGGGKASTRGVFKFQAAHLLQLANYYEDDLTGQSKRKLWQRVDKDESNVIESGEMTLFLYFSILVFIKAKFPSAKLPKKDNPDFKRQILDPLKRWLLHFKVSSNGLTYEEYDQFFSSWIRQYHREVSSHGGGFDVRTDDDGGDDSKYDAGNDGPLRQGTAFLKAIPRSKWPRACRDWIPQLPAVAGTISRTDSKTRKKLWDKIDKHRAGRVDSEKSLFRFLGMLISLHVKSKNRSAKAPRMDELKPLLFDMCLDIREMLPNQNVVTKGDFILNIGKYMERAAQKQNQ